MAFQSDAARAMSPNLAIDTDVLSAGFRQPTVRRSFLRYTDAICSVPLDSAFASPAPHLPSRRRAVGVRAACARQVPRTTAGFGRARDRRQSCTPRPTRTAMMKGAISSTRECRPSQARCGSVGGKWSVAPRGLQKGPLYNKAVDTDVLSAGFRQPTVRRSLLR
jgi:hypothetical protein